MLNEDKFYRVGEPACADGCCTPVFTRDMLENLEKDPLFFVETEYKAQLAAALLGVTLEEVETFVNIIQEGIKGVKLYEQIRPTEGQYFSTRGL